MSRIDVGLGCAALALAHVTVSAQSPTPPDQPQPTHVHIASQVIPAAGATTDALISRAREATEAFRDRNVAIAAGYRRLGVDFPSMGEHWVNPRLVIEGTFDVGRPAMLTYIVVEGRPVLSGIVYAIPLEPGEAPPQTFGDDAIWHEHNGTVDEESVLPQHHATPSEAKSTRLAILHVWLRRSNPAGVFAAENWALPFARLGLSNPDRFPTGAARALSLLSGGAPYFLDLANTSEAGTRRLSAALAECAATASSILIRARVGKRELDDVDLAALEHAWAMVLSDVGSFSGGETARRINGGTLPEPSEQ